MGDNKSDVKMDESRMTLVAFGKVGYIDKLFTMAKQASQVFYVKDHAYEHWFVALHGKKHIDPNEDNLSNPNIADTRSFKRTINVNEVPLVYDVHAIREDHDEGIYI